MDIDTTIRGTRAVLKPNGRLNMVAAPAVKAAIDQTVGDGHPQVVIDLSETSFMDSSGLGALIGGLKAARQAGGDLRIAAAPEQVMTVLRLTNLDRVLRTHRTVDEALSGW